MLTVAFKPVKTKFEAGLSSNETMSVWINMYCSICRQDCLFVFSIFDKSSGYFKFFFFLSENLTKASKPHDSLMMGNYWLAFNILIKSLSSGVAVKKAARGR